MANNISRRAFIGLKSALEDAVVPPNRGILSGLDPYQGAWTEKEVRHLLLRTTFGVSPAHVALLKAMSIEEAIATILMPQPVSDVPINNYNGYEYEDNGTKKYVNDKNVALGKTWLDADYDLEVEFWRNMSLKGWWLNNIIEQTPSIHEKMLLFWHNHIPIQFIEVYNARLSYRYLKTIRDNALGNFKALVKQVTISPAMLFYLNGTYNEKWEPDENYARELQELFCIGKGPNSKYTEDDVKAAARVLTGWKATWQTPTTYFNPNVHDAEDKQFSAFYNNKIIKGKSGQDGQNELDELLDIIFANDEVALFICRKLYRFFVYSQIDAVTESNIIVPLAQIFRQNNYDILPVLKTLLSSQHFFDQLNRSVLIKTPLDFAVGFCREFKVKMPPKTDYNLHFIAYSGMYWWLEGMMQGIGDPPNVAGWPAWYQLPQYDRSWLSTASIAQRAQNSDMLVYWGYGPDQDHLSGINELTFTASLSNPSDVNSIIDEVTARMSFFDLSNDLKKHLKSLLLYNQTNEQYWTIAWNDYFANPTDMTKINNVRWRLRPFYQYLLQLEEYQLM